MREHVRISHESKQNAVKAESETEDQATITTTAASTTTTQTETTSDKVIYLEKI